MYKDIFIKTRKLVRIKDLIKLRLGIGISHSISRAQNSCNFFTFDRSFVYCNFTIFDYLSHAKRKNGLSLIKRV